MKHIVGITYLAALITGGSIGGALVPCTAALATQPQVNSTGLTLESAIRIAVSNSPGLRASSGRVQAQSGQVYQAAKWSNPELELATEDMPARSGSFRDSKNTIGVSQSVPWPGKMKLDRDAARSGVRAGEAELKLHRLELVRNTTVAYYRVLAAERLASVSRELAQVAEAAADTARKRAEAGAIPSQEQMRAEVQSDQARTELAAFTRETTAARLNLATLLAEPGLAQTPLADALPEAVDPALSRARPEQWLAAHPLLAAARAQVDRARLEQRRAALEPYPDVRLGVAGGREGRDDSALVEFRVALPLPVIDRSKGRQQEARANVTVAEAELAEAEQRLLRDWNLAQERLQAAAEQATAYRDRIVPKATEALRLVQSGFEQGKFGFIDLLDTQRTAAEARQAYARRLLELNLAQAEVESFVRAAAINSATQSQTSPPTAP